MEKLPKVGLPILVAAVICIIILFKSVITIDAGYAGVLYKLNGGVDPESEPLGEGINFVAPWNSVIEYEVRQQEIPEKMSVLSSNGLDKSFQDLFVIE